MDTWVLDLAEQKATEFQISLVDDPAIDSDWVAFNSKDNKFKFVTNGDQFKITSQAFKVEDEDKRIISGYAMIADLKIPRFDDYRGAYNVVFQAENIEKIWLNFHRNSLDQATNIMHQTDEKAQGVFVCESIFLDSKRGTLPPKGFKVEADGSWFISMRVENDKVWEQVKKGTLKAFSIEGHFRERKFTKDFTKELESIINNNKMEKQSIKDKLKEFFNANPEAKKDVAEVVAEKFETVKTQDGLEMTIEPAVEVDAAIVVMDESGNPIAAPMGEYILEDGRVIVVEVDGVVAEVKEMVADGEEIVAPVVEPMGEESPQQQKVKRIIERIESEKIFAKIEGLSTENKFLKEENEAFKVEMVEFKKSINDQFEALKTFSKEIFEELLDEPTKSPVKPVFNPFKGEEKQNIFLKSKNK